MIDENFIALDTVLKMFVSNEFTMACVITSWILEFYKNDIDNCDTYIHTVCNVFAFSYDDVKWNSIKYNYVNFAF